GPHLYLVHAFARDAELLRQILEGRRAPAQSPLARDVAFAVVQVRHCLFEQIAAQPQLLQFTGHGFRVLVFVDGPILPSVDAVAPLRQSVTTLLTNQRFSDVADPPQNASSFIGCALIAPLT